jgi:hypothetical protein
MKPIDPLSYESIQKLEQLYDRLSQKVFLKTKIDIVYSDYMNWERGGLLMNKYTKGKKSPKMMSYIEYIWTKVVDELRRYNFSYNEIITFKDRFFEDLSEHVIEIFKSDIEIVKQKLADHLTKEEIDSIDFSQIQGDSDHYTRFYDAIKTVILDNEEYFIIISREDTSVFQLVSNIILRDQRRLGINTMLEKLESKTHLRISFSNIVSQFITTGKDNIHKLETSILSNEEHKILKIVRNKPQELKSINIKFTNQKPVSLEIKSMKKVQVESRLLEFIKKGEYLNIEIASHDGEIVKFENTKKIKL